MNRRRDLAEVLWGALLLALWIAVTSVGFVSLAVLLGYSISP